VIKKYSYDEKDFKTSQVIPGLLGTDKRMNLKRFVTAEDLTYRAGFARMETGTTFESFYWYDEFWCIIEGKGRVECINRASGEKTEWSLGPRDLFFVSRGEWIKPTAVSTEPFLFFYCAIPAASKDAPWLAHMTDADIYDVRKREEF